MASHDVREVPLASIRINKGQVRRRIDENALQELARSIEAHGLLEPIVVTPGEAEGAYELISGQRRFIAHGRLKRETILASVVARQMDETQARVVSLTENLVRENLAARDLIESCTNLYRTYGSMKAVADESALPYHKVRQYVKYDRLNSVFKELVDIGKLALQVALRAQDVVESACIATSNGNYKARIRVLSTELIALSPPQQKRLLRTLSKAPDSDIADVARSIREEGKVVQMLIALPMEVHARLQRLAQQTNRSQDDVARELISKSLATNSAAGSRVSRSQRTKTATRC